MNKQQLIQIRVNDKEKKEFKRVAKKRGFKTMSSFIFWLLRNSSKLLIFVLFLLALSGCTTAGPFVTNVSSDGRGGLNIEKARVKTNFWTGGLETCETTQANIQLYNK